MTGDALALTAAARRGPDAVSAALDAGADPNARDTEDWSPLDHAGGAGDVRSVRLLLAAGADPTATGRELRTAYEIALAAGHREAAAVLREAEEAADPASAERHVWRPYCKAYVVSDLRRFAGWSEEPSGEPMDDDAVVFVHDDRTVTRSIWPGEDVVFPGGTPEWDAFCRDELKFGPPDDFALLP
ncbi:ankyrin repeat domain-containing protein [Actinokineospora guangxiensis]|uniref:Ankyrin repeat domain-containing protein n=1 Tax=Actinokineospora guangxiensis TaxID=1490288 RepID=A0ABW0EM42_9PSEU